MFEDAYRCRYRSDRQWVYPDVSSSSCQQIALTVSLHDLKCRSRGSSMSLWVCLDISCTWYAVFRLWCWGCYIARAALRMLFGCTSHERSWGMTTVFTNGSKQHDHFILWGRSSICFNSYIHPYICSSRHYWYIILRYSNSAFCPHSVEEYKYCTQNQWLVTDGLFQYQTAL